MIATYAAYVWGCYGVTAVVLVAILWSARRSHVAELRALRRRRQMQHTAQSTLQNRELQ